LSESPPDCNLLGSNGLAVEASKLSSSDDTLKSSVVSMSQSLEERLEMLDAKSVKKLEHKLEKAIIEVILEMGMRRLPLLPSHQTIHLMSKAAVAVYEAAVENCQPRE
jgi:hypothetical protein